MTSAEKRIESPKISRQAQQAGKGRSEGEGESNNLGK